MASIRQPRSFAIFTYLAAISACQVCRVDKGDGPAQIEPLFQQITHRGEDAAVDGLVGFVVGKLQANGVARNRVDSESRKVS